MSNSQYETYEAYEAYAPTEPYTADTLPYGVYGTPVPPYEDTYRPAYETSEPTLMT